MGREERPMSGLPLKSFALSRGPGVATNRELLLLTTN